MLQRKISQLLSFSLMPLKQCKSPSTYSKGFLEGEETDIFSRFYRAWGILHGACILLTTWGTSKRYLPNQNDETTILKFPTRFMCLLKWLITESIFSEQMFYNDMGTSVICTQSSWVWKEILGHIRSAFLHNDLWVHSCFQFYCMTIWIWKCIKYESQVLLELMSLPL